uniref:G-protein coupled receptors family 1 profile domain-containing protein n=1 Tax=Amazona collaria TaxID=241587 RepID=A0A8B9G839_9PSIT
PCLAPPAAGAGCGGVVAGAEPRWAAAGSGERGEPFAATAALLAASMGLLVLVTVLGNARVILACLVDRSLRKQSNFFLNLAIANLLVGIALSACGFCIPLYIPYVLTGERRLGSGLCKLWLVVHRLSLQHRPHQLDRFISVTRAVRIAAFLLYGPAIQSWEHTAQKRILPERECHAEFFYNWYFLMIASTIEFFTPFITVTYFNLSIYLNIRKHTSLRKKKLSPVQEDTINPVLCPLCHMSFRKAFIKLLCLGKAKIHPHIFM